MSETATREERRDALNEFAKTTMMPPTENAMVPVVNNAAPAIIGAQPIKGDRRDVARVLQEIKTLAAAEGTNWFYRWPVENRRERRTDYVEGPSIKLAMAVMGIVGNIEVDTRVQDFGQTFMIYARAIDVEKGSAVTRAFQQNKSAAKMGGDKARNDDMALQIGQSKAIRNAICALLETYTDFAFEEARNSLVDKIGKDLLTWRGRTVEKLSAKIDIKRVEAIIGRTSDQWLAPDVARVIAMGKAVEDGMATLDDTFPPLDRGDEPKDTASSKLDEFTKEPDERSMVDQSDAGSSGSNVSNPAPETAAAAPSSHAAAAQNQEIARQMMRGAIDTCLRLAGNTQLTDNEKLEQLDNISPAFEGITPDFAKTVVKTAADVVRGKLKPTDARRYLEGMMK